MDDFRVFYISMFSISEGCREGLKDVGSCLYRYDKGKSGPTSVNAMRNFYPFMEVGEMGPATSVKKIMPTGTWCVIFLCGARGMFPMGQPVQVNGVLLMNMEYWW